MVYNLDRYFVWYDLVLSSLIIITFSFFIQIIVIVMFEYKRIHYASYWIRIRSTIYDYIIIYNDTNKVTNKF